MSEPQIDVARLADWMDGDALPGKGEPLTARFLSGGTQNVIYELRRGEEQCVIRMPPPGAPPDRDKGILREWRIIEALDGTEVPHTKAVGVCPDASVLGRPFYLMGFVDGWSPMDQHGKWPEPFDSDPDSRRRAELPTGRGHCVAVQGRLAGEGTAGSRPPGRLPRTPGRPLDRLLRTDQEARAAGLDVATDWLRDAQAARLHPRPDARRLSVRQRHVPARRPSAIGGHRRLGDGHGRRPEAGPRLDGAELARWNDAAAGSPAR